MHVAYNEYDEYLFDTDSDEWWVVVLIGIVIIVIQ